MIRQYNKRIVEEMVITGGEIKSLGFYDKAQLCEFLWREPSGPYSSHRLLQRNSAWIPSRSSSIGENELLLLNLLVKLYPSLASPSKVGRFLPNYH